MTTSGWIVMIASVGSVTGLFLWCLYRVLAFRPPADKMHGFKVDPEGEGNSD